MLPQRQRAGRGRIALLLGCSVAGFLLLVLLAHPSLLPWNAPRSAGVAAAAEPPPWNALAEGEELHLDLDMVQQQRLIESIHKARPMRGTAPLEWLLFSLLQGACDVEHVRLALQSTAACCSVCST